MAEPHSHGVPGVWCYEKHETETERADKWLDRAQDCIGYFTEALDILAHIVSQANVNPVGDGDFIERYDMPVGSIHKAIPFLQRHGIVVDTYGGIHRSPSIWPQPFEGMNLIDGMHICSDYRPRAGSLSECAVGHTSHNRGGTDE